MLEKYPNLSNIAKNFVKAEIISTTITKYNILHCQIFQPVIEFSQKHIEELQKQLIQHNILVVARYYERIQLVRLAGLLGVCVERAEDELCEAINNKFIKGKIDRMQGIVNFKLNKNENDIVNEWNADINKIYDLIDKTCNLIKRE